MRDPHRRNKRRKCGLFCGRFAKKLIAGVALCRVHLQLVDAIKRAANG